MVCCAIISLILAGLFWPARAVLAKLRPQKMAPLMWHLAATPSPVTAHDIGLSQAIEAAPRFSLAARAKSVSYALSGLGFVIRNEHNARIHIAAAMSVIAMGAAYRIEAADWRVLIMAIIGVWFAETINTAFEYLCDVVSPEKNESVRRAKDIAAGAVLITAIGAVIVGAIVMGPYISKGLDVSQAPQGYAAALADNLCRIK